MTQRLQLDQVLDPFSSRVQVVRGRTGQAVEARLDLAGLPRVDAMLTGRAVEQVPPLVERLCGVCPVAHHLAGIQALEALMGVVELPQAALAMRRLLQLGSVLQMHALRFAVAGYAPAAELRRFGGLVLAAAGSPGHFPATAVVGGVSRGADPVAVARCLESLPVALAAAQQVVDLAMAQPVHPDRFDGANVALVDQAGQPDPLGTRLRAVAGDGTVLTAGAAPSQFDALVAESVPGSPAPRPYLIPLGPERGHYRVGPVAQIRVGRLATPLAGSLQAAALTRSGLVARAVMTLNLVEQVAQSVGGAGLPGGPVRFEPPPADLQPVGTGWVDGARGLLVHRYQVTPEGQVTAAQVLTPTAQNEYWLAQLLRHAVGHQADGPVAVTTDLEDAIREADPCLPCSMAPPGQMGLVVKTINPEPKAKET